MARSKLTKDRPEPMTPPDCRLDGVSSMMVDLNIFDSDLFALSTGDQFKAALKLYGASYNQVPAGSLPADDRVLAHLSSYSLKDWVKMRPISLRGWIECRDGRLYHRVTAEKVCIVWLGRLRKRLAAGTGNQTKHDSFTFDRAPIEAQITATMECLARANPDAREVAKWRSVSQSSRSARPERPAQRSQGKGEGEGYKKDPSQSSAQVVGIGGMRA